MRPAAPKCTSVRQHPPASTSIHDGFRKNAPPLAVADRLLPYETSVVCVLMHFT